MLVSKENIGTIIPQRPPFVFIDNLVDINDNGCSTDFEISDNCPLVINGKLSEAGLIENIAQTAAAGAGYPYKIKGEEPPIGFIGAVKKFSVNELPDLGTKIETRVKIVTKLMNASVVDAEVISNNRIIANCSLNIFIQE